MSRIAARPAGTGPAILPGARSATSRPGRSPRGVPARWLRLLVVVVVLTVTPMAVIAGSVPPAGAAETLELVDPVTDNYKTWADDRTGPSYTDNRTSLLFSGIRVGDQTYVVPQSIRDSHGSPVGAPTEWHANGGIPVATSVDGPVVAKLKFDHEGANAWSYFRLWPDGTFGPLMTVNRSVFVAGAAPVAGTFTLTSTGGTVLATRVMKYRYDADIAALPDTSVEWHGALGRWYVGADTTAPTPLNWPSGIAVSPTPTGPHASQIPVPAGQPATLYVAPTDIAGLPVPRVAEGIGLAWNPAGAGRPTTAAGPRGWRPVTVQVPAGSYALQATGTCLTACRYDQQPQALTTAGTTVTASDAPATTYRPDAEIRPVGGSWVGGDVFRPTVQSVSAPIPVGSSRTFEVRVTNDGTATDTFGLADALGGTDAPFDFTWRYAGGDVTSQVHDSGWFVLANVAPGATRTLELTIAARPGATIGASTSLALHAYHSPAADQIKDVVGVAVTAAPAEVTEEPDYVRPSGAPEVPIQPCSRYAGPDGSDANPGTEASPVLSLKRLTDLLQPGQTGCLQDDSEIVLTEGGSGMMSGGTPGLPKIIRPATVGSRATVRSVPKFGVAAATSDLIVMDVNFRGSSAEGGGNLLQINGDRVMLDGVDISWPRNICLGVGASGDEAQDFVLIDSRIHDCGTTHDNDPADPGGAHGAYLQFIRDSGDADAWGAIVYNSVFDHNDGRGLQLYPDADKVLVDRAVLYGNGSNLNVGAYGTAVRSEGNRIRNTIIGDSRLDFDDPVDPNPTSTNEIVGYFPSASHNGADNVVQDSCVYNTVRPDVPNRLFAVTSGGNSLVLANVTQNQPATFVDVAARDFRLTAGSACQGMGLSGASRLPGGPSEPPPVVQDQDLQQLEKPTIVGKLRVGETVWADKGRWTPSPTGFRYRWFVGGLRVDGTAGSKRAFELRRQYRGKRVSVRITALAPAGYRDASVTARRSGTVR